MRRGRALPWGSPFLPKKPRPVSMATAHYHKPRRALHGEWGSGGNAGPAGLGVPRVPEPAAGGGCQPGALGSFAAELTDREAEAQDLSQAPLGGWRPGQASGSEATLLGTEGQHHPCPAPSGGLVPLGGPAPATATSAPLQLCRAGGVSGPHSRVAVCRASAQVSARASPERQRPTDKPPAARLLGSLLACCRPLRGSALVRDPGRHRLAPALVSHFVRGGKAAHYRLA